MFETLLSLFENPTLAHWLWFAIGACLLLLELMGTGGFLLWMGMAGMLVAVLTLLIPISALWQAFLFASLALVHSILWWRYQKQHLSKPERSVNQGAQRYIGRETVLTEAVEQGRGVAHLDDSRWAVTSSTSLPVGTVVKVIAVENDTVLVVEPVAGKKTTIV